MLPSRWRRTRVDKEDEAAVSSEEENKALARRFLEAHVKGDLDAVDEMLAPDFVGHSKVFPSQEPGREGVKWATDRLSAAISNVNIHFEDKVAGGEKVVSRFIVRATHDRGELMGVAPTGIEMSNKAIAIHRIVGDKIAEEWSIGTIGWKLRGWRLEQERIERERVEQELKVARRIQQASLPTEVPEPEGWEIFPHYRPAREVGGDFYDFHFLLEGRLGVVVGDATGKGVPAALVMATTCGMLQLAARALGSPSPVRYSSRSTRRCWLVSLPTCSSPASMPSSSLTAVA
jgi:predicted ester cyclase